MSWSGAYLENGGAFRGRDRIGDRMGTTCRLRHLRTRVRHYSVPRIYLRECEHG